MLSEKEFNEHQVEMEKQVKELAAIISSFEKETWEHLERLSLGFLGEKQGAINVVSETVVELNCRVFLAHLQLCNKKATYEQYLVNAKANKEKDDDETGKGD